MNGGRVDEFTDVETPHFLKAPLIITPYKYPRHIVCKGNRVRTKTSSWGRTPDWSLASVHHGQWHGLDILHLEAGNCTEAGVRGDFVTASHDVAERL